MANVFVSKVGGQCQQVEASTVGDAINASDHDIDGYSIRVNGRDADASDPVTEGASILLVRKIKGASLV